MRVNISLDETVFLALDELAKNLHMSRSAAIRHLIIKASGCAVEDQRLRRLEEKIIEIESRLKVLTT